MFFFEDEMKAAHSDIVHLGRVKASSNMYILKRKITNIKCLLKRGAPC